MMQRITLWVLSVLTLALLGLAIWWPNVGTALGALGCLFLLVYVILCVPAKPHTRQRDPAAGAQQLMDDLARDAQRPAARCPYCRRTKGRHTAGCSGTVA